MGEGWVNPIVVSRDGVVSRRKDGENLGFVSRTSTPVEIPDTSNGGRRVTTIQGWQAEDRFGRRLGVYGTRREAVKRIVGR